MKLYIKDKCNESKYSFYLTNADSIKNIGLSSQELVYVKERIEAKDDLIAINRFSSWVYLHVSSVADYSVSDIEKIRKVACKLQSELQKNKATKLCVIDNINNSILVTAFIEALVLSNYQFIKYFKNKEEKQYSLAELCISSEAVSKENLKELEAICDAVFAARDLVNEPFSFLTAQKLSEEILRLGKQNGFSVEVFGKSKIESLKMGGLLAVNKGSIDPPTFSILEWKPKNAENSKPIVFVGKGIVYDTGGLSLKPTAGSMDIMKTDMGGAAAVVGAMSAIAKAELPFHVIALVPATDNRPSGNAYAPGDVISMMNGTSVEVLNTDAEGRLILGDALCYAQKFDPEFVFDLATLTGSAVMAIGQYGSVVMANSDGEKQMANLKNSGNNVYERVVEFPFWDEYGELIKSDIADIKNLGGREGGAITAGKFLEHFVSYPWIHIDIAGPAYVSTDDSYRGKGASGVGVRLLFDFVKHYKLK